MSVQECGSLKASNACHAPSLRHEAPPGGWSEGYSVTSRPSATREGCASNDAVIQQHLAFLSWNIANIAKREFEQFASDLCSETDWDVLAVQELGNWASGQHWFFKGFNLIGGTKFEGSSVVGILLRSKWYQYLISCDDHPRHLSITLRLCGKEFRFKVFEDTLQSLAEACSCFFS